MWACIFFYTLFLLFLVWKVDYPRRSDVNGSWQPANLPCKCISKHTNLEFVLPNFPLIHEYIGPTAEPEITGAEHFGC